MVTNIYSDITTNTHKVSKRECSIKGESLDMLAQDYDI